LYRVKPTSTSRTSVKRREKWPKWAEKRRKMVKILLNGESREVGAANILALIEEIGIEARKLAVEQNLEIVPRSQYHAAAIHDGDRIEIVHFVGGG
jgi:sulfur carrier protein